MENGQLRIDSFIAGLTSVWDFFKNTKKPIILYGMGDGADKVLNEFERLGIRAYGVMASDDFVRYQTFRGFTVKKLSDFEAELEDITKIEHIFLVSSVGSAGVH